jgi:four helix bundle protein
MNEKVYDLEERTFLFAKAVRKFVKKIEKNIWNKEFIRQVVRSSGSVAANYIEVNDSLGDKDKLMKVRICKKEAKESILWLRLLDVTPEQESERNGLIQETTELKNILGSIYKNLSRK